jgi:chromosome segregation ATPase
VTWRHSLILTVALILAAGGLGYVLGRRPTANERALERRIGELVAENRQLDTSRQAALVVADSARTRAAHSDSATRTALATADRALAEAADWQAVADSLAEDPTATDLEATLALASGVIDTLTAALTATRGQLIEARYVSARLVAAVDSLTTAAQRDAGQIARLQQTLTDLRAVTPGRPLFTLPSGTLGKVVGALAVGFVAGAIVTN